MASSTRIKGVALTLTVNEIDYECDITNARIENEEASDDEVVTFCDAADAARRDFFLRGSALQSTDTASFWSYIWENAGSEGVEYIYAPHGNAVPSASQPHFTGTITDLGAPPVLGGDAGRTNTYTFDFEFKLSGKPVKVITGE